MSPLNGATLMVTQSFKNPVSGTGVSTLTVSLNGPGAKSIFFHETAETASPQALTVQQATELVTASVWDDVWQLLPADCPLGVMSEPHEPRTQTPVLVCTTSRAAALPAPPSPS